MFFDNFEEKINIFTNQQPSEIKSAIRDIETIFYTENLGFLDERIIRLLSENKFIRKDEYGVTLELRNDITLKYYFGDNDYFEKLYILNNLQRTELVVFGFCDIYEKKETIKDISFPIRKFGKIELLNYNIETKELDCDSVSIDDLNKYDFIINNFENSELNDVLTLFFDIQLKEHKDLSFFYSVLSSFKKAIDYDKSYNTIAKNKSI